MAERLLDLLRHGEPQGGARFRGRQDDPLSDLGWEQIRQASANPPGWTRILCSPARRCAEPARWLAETHRLPLAMLETARERAFGAWEGLAADQIPGEDLARFWTDPAGYTPPGAEPFQHFRERVRGLWHQLLTGDDSHTLLVTHGGVIRLLAAEVLGMPAEAMLLLEVPPACLTRLRLPDPPGRPSLVRHGAD